ncbi:MAG: hypothetical protein AB8F74_04815 [Saprospiraceae bacterium]
MKNLKVVIIVFAALFTFQSCVEKEKDNQVLGTAPQLPPAESFIMDFNGYEEADSSQIMSPENGGADARTDTYQNWFHAVSNVVVWNSVLVVNLAIPTAAFRESFNHDAQPQGNGLWVWEYDYQNNNNTFTAKLEGQILDTEEIEWKMYISKENGFQDVLWYSGITSPTQAVWNLNHKPFNPESYLSIEYHKDNGSGEASIKYTNIVPNGDNNGSFIEFQKDETGTADFNRGYDVYLAPNDRLIEIEWNRPGHDGRVKDEIRFGNEEWQCWDESQIDVEC